MTSIGWQRRGVAWAERLARSPLALPVLFLFSFLETIVVPIPIELLLVPWMLMEPRRRWVLATVALAGCLAASLVGYAVGVFLFDSLGQWALATYGHADAYAQFTAYFQRYGFWAIVAIGVVPIPFQAAMLAAGVAGYPLHLFFAATVLARGGRYYGLALLVWLFGGRAIALWRRNRVAATAVIMVVVILAAVIARWLSDIW